MMNAFSECADPSCRHTFKAGRGKFFRFHQSAGEANVSNAHGVRHYWLCDQCSQDLTLRYRADVGVFVASRLYGSGSPRSVAA